MKQRRILHVEDDDSTLLLIRGALGELAELVQTTSVKNARELLANEKFDLVILDFTLPDGSGQMLLKELGSVIEPPDVIVLSGHELTKNIPGVNRVLTKGRYQMKDLIQYVSTLLENK